MATTVRNGTHIASTRIALSEETRERIGDILNVSLATAIDLKTQLKHAHWNVTGLEFLQVHELFDRIATDVEAYVDLIAERATTLGVIAMGTARIAAGRSSLPEFPIHAHGVKAYLEAVAERVGGFANEVRENIKRSAELGDDTTADLYTEVSRGVEKHLWFVEAHLRSREGLAK
jgi:starvation-inducible DNA-binding protein